MVFRRLFPSEQQLSLTKQICAPGIGGTLSLVSSAAFFPNFSAAFDFRAVCIGCPEAGTPEAESARTVAQYVVTNHYRKTEIKFKVSFGQLTVGFLTFIIMIVIVMIVIIVIRYKS